MKLSLQISEILNRIVASNSNLSDRRRGRNPRVQMAVQAVAWESERPNELWIGHRDRPNEILVRDPALLSAAARRHADYPGGHNEGFPDTFKQLFRAFYDYVAGEDSSAQPTFPTFVDGHHEVVLCEAVLRSHREQRWVSLENVAP